MRLSIIASLVLISACGAKDWGCIQQEKIIDIEAITYRGGIVLLESGRRVDVGQAGMYGPIKRGDYWCLRRGESKQQEAE